MTKGVKNHTFGKDFITARFDDLLQTQSQELKMENGV